MTQVLAAAQETMQAAIKRIDELEERLKQARPLIEKLDRIAFYDAPPMEWEITTTACAAWLEVYP
jgi:hypothetical protein